MRKYKIVSVILMVVFALLIGSTIGWSEQEKPRYGGTLTFPCPYGGTISTLDPPHSTRIQSQIVYRNIFDGLVRLDPESLKVVPAIAKDWQVSEDGLTYTFTLKKGVKFHNGRELIAEDVKYTYERIMDPAEATMVTYLFQSVKGVDAFVNGKAEHISGIKVLDDYTVQITLKSVQPTFLYNVANEAAGIVPKEEVEKWGDQFGSHPVGAGPFKFVEWKRGTEVTVKAFEDYYGGRPYLDKIVFKVMPEAAARVPAFKAGELDVDIVYPAQYKAYKKNPKYKDLMVEVAELWTRNITFNLDLDKLKDKRVRQAFNYAIDKDLIIEKLLGGKAYPAIGWLPLTSPAFNPDLKGYEYNPEKAKKLMEQAGYTPDNPLTLEIIGTDHPAWGIPIVEAIMPYLEKVGFKIKPVLVDGATLEDRVTTGKFEAMIWSNGGYVSSLDYLKNYFWSETSRASGRFSHYSNPDFDRLIEKAMRETDFEKRKELLQKADAILVKDAPVWFYNYNKAVAIHQPWVHGVTKSPREMTFQPLSKIWIDERSPRA